MKARDLALARRIRKHGGTNSLRVVLECRRAGIPISLGCAFLTQESNFANVFGHDAVRNPVKGGRVTRYRYKEYLRFRNMGWGNQGVGPCQLTSPGFQDAADRLGGCHIPKYNIRVGFDFVAKLLRTHENEHRAIAAYNGSGAAAERYADSVLHLQKIWHDRLT
jgi:hypothetical protein